MKQTVTICTCDICKLPKITREMKIPVLFYTDQTEGRSCTPYFSNEKVDICDECLDRTTVLSAVGAQGNNKFQFRR